MKKTIKFNILAKRQFNDMTAFWFEEDGRVGFTIIPSGMEEQIAPHRLNLNGLECVRRMCQARECDCAAYRVSNAIQLKIAGDAYGGGYSPGETLFNSGSVDRLHNFNLMELSDGMKLVMTDDRGLELSQTYRCSSSDKFIRVKTTIRNCGTESFDLEYLPSFSLGMLSLFQPDDGSECYEIIRWLSNWSNEGRLEQRPAEEYGLEASWLGFGTRTLRFGEQGSMPVKGFFPQVGFRDHRAGVVWGSALDVMSSWELEVTRQNDFFTINGGYVDREFGQWIKKIEPGATYETPEAALTCAKGDVETLQNRLCSYSLGSVPASEAELPVLFNEWCTSWGKPYPQKIRPIVDRLSGHGIRYFVLDYGWFKSNEDKSNLACIGDWGISHQYGPGSFRCFINHIREKGFIPGLWFEFEIVTEDSAFFKAHPDLLLHLDDKLINSSGRFFLDFRKQKCIDYLSEKVINFLKSYNIGYIKVDYNAPTGFGCDGAESQAEGLRLHTLAIKAFYDKIHAELPDLVMEICASGGHRLTHAWLRQAAMGGFSDAHEGVEIPIIAANTANLIPVRKNQIWAVLRSEDSDCRMHYSLAAGFMGRLCLSGDIANLTNAQFEIVDEAISLYRDAVPVLKDGENHLISKIGLSYVKPSGWQAFVRTNKSQKLVVVHTFKNSPHKISINLGQGWRLTRAFAHNATVHVVEEILEVSNLSDFSGMVYLFAYVGDVPPRNARNRHLRISTLKRPIGQMVCGSKRLGCYGCGISCLHQGMSSDLKEEYKTHNFIKKTLKFIVAVLILLSIIFPLSAQEIIEPAINGTTDKSPLSYNIGEEMVFSFKLEAENSRKKNTYLTYFRRGDDGKIFSGKVSADRDLIVKTSLDRAGFVGIDVFWVDDGGKNILDKGKKVAFYAGAGVQAETLQDCGEPPDFDEFWAKQRAKLANVPFKENIEKNLLFTKGNMSYYTVKVPCCGTRPMTAYLCMPTKPESHSLKAEVHFMGYGAYKVTCPTIWPKKDRITLVVNAHGMELQQSDEYYKSFFASIRTEKYGYAFNPEENKNAETAYFYGMAMRALRALDYVKTLSEWDRKNLIAVGGSQAGLQTMWVTALDKDVTEAYPSIIWCCDMAGSEKKSRCHGGWRVKYFPALDYYDPVFMAKRIKSAKVVITRAGLGDYICPPSGLAVCYNNLATSDKEIVWVQGSCHDFTPKNHKKIIWSNK